MSFPGIPYGFDDDAETRRLLRSRPPRRALDWAGSVLGGTVAATRALRGGTASAVHLLTVVTAAGGTYRAVLRRYVRPELNLEEPDLFNRFCDDFFHQVESGRWPRHDLRA